MKSILKTSVLAALFILTSCAHHSGCNSCGSHASQCSKNKEGAKEQCPMKSENKDLKESDKLEDTSTKK